MAGPWEKYQSAQAADDGPWSKYQAQPSVMDEIKQGAGNLAAGAVRGIGSIGATILAPVDVVKDLAAGKGLTLDSNRQRRADMDSALESMGAQPESLLYKTGKIGGEIAWTAGAGGVLANGVRAVAPASPLAAKLAEAVASGGFKLGSPAATTLAGKAGDLAIRAGGGAILGGSTAAMVNPEDAALGAAIGGALPVGAAGVGKVSNAIGKMLRGGDVSPEVRALAERAQELGINVPADRLVNSRPMNALASTLDYVPFSGRAGTMSRMQDQINTAASRTIGQDSTNLTGAIRAARDELGSKFDSVLKSNAVRVDDAFLNDLAGAAATAKNELPSSSAAVIERQVDEILSKAKDGVIDGQAAYNIKKSLDRMGNANSESAFYARELRDKLMDALNRSLPDGGSELSKLRQQWGNMRTLEKFAQNGAEGDVSIARLANAKGIRNKDLQELADISAQFLKSRENPHGAMQRAVMSSVALSTLGGIPAVIASAAGGRGVNSALNSNALRQIVLGESAPVLENKLIPLIAARTAPVLSAQ